MSEVPEGDYAIVEMFGHQTLVGRVTEVEQFATKFCQVEILWEGALLPPLLVGGGALYSFTPVDRETALRKQARDRYQLPPAVRAKLPPPPFPGPAEGTQRLPLSELLNCEELACSQCERPLSACVCGDPG